jgi:hypothetical protein
MHSSLKPKPTDDPHDYVVIPSDAVRVAPSDDEISDLLRAAARQRSDAQTNKEPDPTVDEAAPPLDATFRPTAVNDDFAPRRSRVMRTIATLLIAACIGAAAMAWQASGYAAKKLVAKWIPQFALTGSLPWDKLGLSVKLAPPTGEPDTADATPPATAPIAQPDSAQAARESTASNTEPSDPAASLQSMARDLASVSQEVEALKASIAELKASQQQMARDFAKASDKASEQNAHARISPAPPRAAVANARRPAPPYSPSPAAPAPAYRPPQTYSATQATPAPAMPQTAQPYVPRQVEPLPPPQVEPVPRPPMPVQ